ncbi:hypothetical protein L208DRAFT_1524656, partial [Tricholoma matsutake]
MHVVDSCHPRMYIPFSSIALYMGSKYGTIKLTDFCRTTFGIPSGLVYRFDTMCLRVGVRGLGGCPVCFSYFLCSSYIFSPPHFLLFFIFYDF